jgi:hypothetical protein
MLRTVIPKRTTQGKLFMDAYLHRILPIAALVAISGCNSTPLTTTKEPMALDFALKRARFEMNCPAATGSVLSKETIEPPAARGPRFQGVERAQFTVGVTGCSERKSLVVICADGADGCFAADSR